jgi:hypothetical protein
MLWPWYVVPCAMCLSVAGGRRAVMAATALSVGAAMSGLPMPVLQMQRVSVATAAAVIAACAVVMLRRRPARELAAARTLTVS